MEGTKLAGPAAGGYGGGQKMSSHKRKRDKAQEKLRNRMRHRMNGNGNSSAILHAKRHASILDGRGDTSLSAGLKHSSSLEITSRDLQGTNYWRTQQERYNMLSQMAGDTRPPRLGVNQTVPLQELVDRVLQRKEQNQQSLGLGSKVSPMTIRAYKPPVAPYAIQQGSNVKKIVKMKPVQREDDNGKGPFVLVLQRNDGDGGEGVTQARGRRRSRNRSSTNHDNLSIGTNKVLPPVSSSRNSGVSDVNTWRPELEQIHKKELLPEAEDRSVTNYRLQLQHANRLAENRFEFNHHVTATQTVEDMTMQSLNPLPPIQSVYSEDRQKEETRCRKRESGESEARMDGDRESSDPQPSEIQGAKAVGSNRTASKSEILNLRKAQKEAKRQKQAQTEEVTLLRTRKRYTNKTKQFKSELERARQLSAIQEDRSSLSSARLSRSSGEMPSMTSSASSTNSLKRIEETYVVTSMDFDIDGSSSGTDDYSSEEESPRDISIADVPPTTPSMQNELGSRVIMNVDVMNSSIDNLSSDESSIEGDVEEKHLSGSDMNTSSPSSSSPSAQFTQSSDASDEMTWENSPLRQKSTPEHGR